MNADRERSHWGWGWADAHPDRAAREALGGQISALLGFGPSGITDPVPLQAATIRPSAVTVPPRERAWVTVADAARARRTYGRAFPDQLRGLHGDFGAAPDAVATPRDETELEQTLEWAASADLRVVPFGGGTSVVGGLEVPDAHRGHGVVALDLGHLNALHEVDPISRLARIGAGALGPDLERDLSAHGLTLRHFPQSFEFSTLGGWIATRAGGHFATLYTHIDDLVAGLRMVTPGAGWLSVAPLPGDGAGPAPERLAIGSEGTLGVITEAWMRVRPRPHWRASATVLFADFTQAVEATRAIAGAGLYPANCRLLDAREAALNFVTQDGRCVVILGFESADHDPSALLQRALAVCADQGGDWPGGPVTRAGEKVRAGGAAAWRSAFLNGPYLQSTLLSLGVIADTFETACRWSTFPALHADLVKNVRAAMREACGAGRLTCRFTHVYPDGPAPYFTFIAPGRPGGELDQWAHIKRAACDTLLAHGATITHHHAVGRTHAPWHAQQRSPAWRAAFGAVKSTLDPRGILNPGVIFPPD